MSANAAQLNHLVTQMIEASATSADDDTKDTENSLLIPTSSGKLRRIFCDLNGGFKCWYSGKLLSGAMSMRQKTQYIAGVKNILYYI